MILPDKHKTPKRAPQSNNGFTLIELMVVVAIVSVLAVIAIPAYLDYVTRSKVSEAMAFVSEAKTAVSEAYYSTKNIPTRNSLAGLPEPDEYDKHDYISRLEIMTGTAGIKAGTIRVTIKIDGADINGKYIDLVPSTEGDVYMGWTCTTADGGARLSQVPPSCRGI